MCKLYSFSCCSITWKISWHIFYGSKSINSCVGYEKLKKEFISFLLFHRFQAIKPFKRFCVRGSRSNLIYILVRLETL